MYLNEMTVPHYLELPTLSYIELCYNLYFGTDLGTTLFKQEIPFFMPARPLRPAVGEWQLTGTSWCRCVFLPIATAQS